MRPLKKLLLPSATSLIVSAILTLAILVGSNFAPLINTIVAPHDTATFSTSYHEYADPVFHKINGSEDIAKLTNILVWMGLGMFVYVIMWLIINTWISVRNDTEIGAYAGATGRGGSYWLNLMTRGLLRFSAAVLILLLTTLTVQIWYPLSIFMFRLWANDWSTPEGWAFALSAVLIWMVVLHAYLVLTRLVLLRTDILS